MTSETIVKCPDFFCKKTSHDINVLNVSIREILQLVLFVTALIYSKQQILHFCQF